MSKGVRAFLRRVSVAPNLNSPDCQGLALVWLRLGSKYQQSRPSAHDRRYSTDWSKHQTPLAIQFLIIRISSSLSIGIVIIAASEYQHSLVFCQSNITICPNHQWENSQSLLCDWNGLKLIFRMCQLSFGDFENTVPEAQTGPSVYGWDGGHNLTMWPPGGLSRKQGRW